MTLHIPEWLLYGLIIPFIAVAFICFCIVGWFAWKLRNWKPFGY